MQCGRQSKYIWPPHPILSFQENNSAPSQSTPTRVFYTFRRFKGNREFQYTVIRVIRKSRTAPAYYNSNSFISEQISVSLFSNEEYTIIFITIPNANLKGESEKEQPWRTPFLVVNASEGMPDTQTQLQPFACRYQINETSFSGTLFNGNPLHKIVRSAESNASVSTIIGTIFIFHHNIHGCSQVTDSL